jgi:hypothetical protein
LMWMPALASLVARLALSEGVADVSFRFGGRLSFRTTLIAWFYPLLVGGIAYGHREFPSRNRRPDKRCSVEVTLGDGRRRAQAGLAVCAAG